MPLTTMSLAIPFSEQNLREYDMKLKFLEYKVSGSIRRSLVVLSLEGKPRMPRIPKEMIIPILGGIVGLILQHLGWTGLDIPFS